MTTTQTEAPFSKEAFIRAWVDSADIQGWASFVNNIQKHAGEIGAKKPKETAINLRLCRYTKEIEGLGATAPSRPARPSMTPKVETKEEFYKRMGLLK
jgi:hypothetical protein|tara:strand:- start:594 stop:887 length:294 start_codon:yes stop_codon:yes gene_type:complete